MRKRGELKLMRRGFQLRDRTQEKKSDMDVVAPDRSRSQRKTSDATILLATD
jgi:hypothetical protein